MPLTVPGAIETRRASAPSPSCTVRLQLPPGDHQPGSPQDRRSSQPSQVDPKNLRCQNISTPIGPFDCLPKTYLYAAFLYFSFTSCHSLSVSHNLSQAFSLRRRANVKSVGHSDLGHLALAAARRMQGDTTLRTSPPAARQDPGHGWYDHRSRHDWRRRVVLRHPPPYLVEAPAAAREGEGGGCQV